mmetsp:Transcript_57195/g.139439  ORF Transcript_57195/g.139439 Transcript_57195/m.139439 type:complete len:264 (-) Transcript_57195:568-1359(-)
MDIQANGFNMSCPIGRLEWNPKTINRPVGCKTSIDCCIVETPFASATTAYPFGQVSVTTFHHDDDDDDDDDDCSKSDLSTTMSQPSCFAASTLDVRPTTPTTGLICNNFAIRTIILPTPPAAECIKIDFFVVRRPSSRSVVLLFESSGNVYIPPRYNEYNAVRETAGILAACSNENPSGIFRNCCVGTRQRVLYPPKNVAPYTRSPTWNSGCGCDCGCGCSPAGCCGTMTCSTTPAISKPGTIGQPTNLLADSYKPHRIQQSA